RFGVDINEAGFGPEHRAQIEGRALWKSADPFPNDLLDLACRFEDPETERFCRVHEALAMAVKIGSGTLEGAGAVEYAGAKPWRVGPRPHDQRIAFEPRAFEPRPGCGLGFLECHDDLRSDKLTGHARK